MGKTKEATTGQVPCKLEMSMSDEDFNLLKEYIQRDDINSFIEIYKAQNPTLSNDNIMSLALMRAVKIWNISIPSKILDALYKNDSAVLDPLVTLDENGNNTILYALEDGKYIPQLSACIFNLTENKEVGKKFVLEQDMLDKMVYALQHLRFEDHPRTLINEIIAPVYTEESVQELRETLGEDWLDSYYT